MDRIYMAIDLKSFYASVECITRGLDPFNVNLVVADNERTEKTICLAVSPALKSYGIGGRPRLFEVASKVKEINRGRGRRGESFYKDKLDSDRTLALSYMVAPPRMAEYIKWSTMVYNIYLKYFSPDDIHVYSIDEVFIDITGYLKLYKMTPKELAARVLKDINGVTKLTATAGIGTNLYLSKIAMDIGAKHAVPDENGARISYLDEMSYRKLLWDHKPLSDFWRVGAGYERRLHENGIYTMGDVARCSVSNEELLYSLFGVNAQLLIDHSWGYEPCTMEDIKNYRPKSRSIFQGQVLQRPYKWEETRLIVEEMIEALSLDLLDKGLATDQIYMRIGYDIDNLKGGDYTGEIVTDAYGRKKPKSVNGRVNMEYTCLNSRIKEKALELYDRITDRNLLSRRVSISANNLMREENIVSLEQLDMFTDYEKREEEKKLEEKEKNIQKSLLEIKKRFGKNAVIKGTSLEEASTAAERNRQIGGHKA